MDTAKAMSDKTGDAFANGGAISKIDSFGVASCKVNLQLVLGAQWQSEKHVYQFSGGMQVLAAGIGAAGAAVLAYERRRAKGEKS